MSQNCKCEDKSTNYHLLNCEDKISNIKKESLTLKWGTLKEWEFHSPKAEELLKEYGKIGACSSAMMQKDTPRQKEIICELIDVGNFEKVYLDWDNIYVSKEKAKKYVMGYGLATT